MLPLNGNGEQGKWFEQGLPEYLQQDLEAYKEALEHGSTLLDCLWCELYGSINAAEITDGVISHEHAEYLRNKYLRGETAEEEYETTEHRQGFA